jgi:hypothetical protein
MEALAKELRTLSDYLGDDRDLVVLSQHIQEEGYGQKHPREEETLHAIIGERQREFRAAALHIGPRLYAENRPCSAIGWPATGGFGAAQKSERSSSWRRSCNLRFGQC